MIASSKRRSSRKSLPKISASRSSSAGALGLGEPDREHLARIVPLVQRRQRVESLVALEPDQPRAEHVRKDLGALGLAHTRRTFDEERLVEGEHELQRSGKGIVDDEASLAEPRADGLCVDHPRVAANCCGSLRKRRRQFAQQKYWRVPFTSAICRAPAISTCIPSLLPPPSRWIARRSDRTRAAGDRAAARACGTP